MEESNKSVNFSLSRGDLAVSASVSAEFFDEKVLPVIEALVAEISHPNGSVAPGGPGNYANSGSPHSQQKSLNMSVKMVASKLGVSSGADVLKAGAISLALVNGKPLFSRKELLDEAQKATGYWKKNIASNATKYIKTLLASDFLIEVANGQLGLSAAAEVQAAKIAAN